MKLSADICKDLIMLTVMDQQALSCFKPLQVTFYTVMKQLKCYGCLASYKIKLKKCW